MKRKLLILCLLLSVMNVSCTEKNGTESSADFVSEIVKPYSYPFLGFGYNQYPLDLNTDGSDNPVWTEERYAMMEERIRAINPGLVRIPVVRQWYNPSMETGEYDWDTPEMQACYKFFDLYKEMGVDLLCGWWHVTTYETDAEGYKDDDNVTAFVDFIEYMLEERGYDNMIYMQPSNEPYGTYTQFSDWSSFMRKAYDQCMERGLPNTLCGPDSWDDWIGRAAMSNSKELVSYNFHFYFDGTAASSENLGLYDQLKVQMDYVYDNDPASVKPVVCGEVGAINGGWLDWPSNAPEGAIYSFDYIYAVYMIDFAIQAMRAGVSSSLSWGLHGFDQNKDAGMWNNTGNWGGTKLRPLYYAWSLLCRYFPSGATVLDMSQKSGKVKIGGVNVGNGDYSFVVCSLAGYEDEVSIRLPEDSKDTWYVYTFSEVSQGDGEQLSIPYEPTNAKETITIKVPAESAVFITTMQPLESQNN